MEWYLQLLLAVVLLVISMMVIMYACDAFEPASDYLGTEVYKLGPGVRGASIEAIASSLPELFTTMFLLFIFHDEDGFAAGIATCAGSAVFNGAVIPALCIFAVTVKGMDGETVEEIQLLRRTLVRDGFFFLSAEITLIVMLNSATLNWWMGLILMAVYFIYAGVLITTAGTEEDEEEERDEDANKADDAEAPSDSNSTDDGGNPPVVQYHQNPMEEDSSPRVADVVQSGAQDPPDRSDPPV
eukprot:SAG11_NODE_1292_length_5285_cov_9.364057_6_plen_242_part_00